MASHVGDFARKQLEKQGWRQGKGLGKEENGIPIAIKVGIKNDTAGLGHNIGNQFQFHWWDHIFNKTASNIVVQESEDGVKLSKKEGAKFTPLSTKQPSKHHNKPMLYGKFVKASSQTVKTAETSASDSEEEKDFSSNGPEGLLFQACGGRTAHKAARHGLRLNGKLKRIEEQERKAVTQSSSPSKYEGENANSPCKKGKVSDRSFSEKPSKSKKKSKKRSPEELEVKSEKKVKQENDETCPTSDERFERFYNRFTDTDDAKKYKKKKKKKKKKRKEIDIPIKKRSKAISIQ